MTKASILNMLIVGVQRYSSMTDLTLRRPREFIKPTRVYQEDVDDVSVGVDSLGPPPSLRRPREYHEQQSYPGYTSPLTVRTTPPSPSHPVQPGISVF